MKTLVIASGKGGTGKTTLTALFALLAAAERRTLVADCDVEASNLPLALRVEVESRQEFVGAGKPVLDDERCAACGLCLDCCRFGALSLAADDTPLFDEWLCEGCGACVDACPMHAIELKPQVAGELLAGHAVTGEVVFARLDPGEDLSGRLVSDVRTCARELAQERGAELLLVDGPPGVGCPAIASLASADALLAVAEPSRSGAHDLRRLAMLARQLGIPVKVALNKADLSSTGAEHLRGVCLEQGLEMIGEVPFDSALAAMPERLAEGRQAGVPLEAGPGLSAATALWRLLERWLAED
jgi:MinD superfamily P-loop ATPase